MSDKKSLRQSNSEKGIISNAFTLNKWFVNITPAYGIDKIKFSFVMKGSQGKDSFDVYVDPLYVKVWAQDIRSGRFFNVLLAEKQAGEQYPKYYKYTTGNSGEKHVGFMNSTNGGYCINAKTYEGEKNKFANVPVDNIWLRMFAEMYLTVHEESGWEKKHADTILKASEAYRSNLTDADKETPLDEMEIDCEMYGEVKQHNNFMRSVAIKDTVNGNDMGRLYVKDSDFWMNGKTHIRVQKKGDDYLKIS